MNIEMTVLDDDSGEDLGHLGQWLRDDEGLRFVPIVAIVTHPAAGEMAGGVVAALEAAVASKEFLLALTTAVGGWLASRAAGRRTRIRVRRGDQEVEIDTAKIRDAHEIARRIYQELDDERL